MASVPACVREVGKPEVESFEVVMVIRSRSHSREVEFRPSAPAVQRDRENDDGAGDDLLHPVRQAPLRAADLDDGHRAGAEHGADDRTAPAEKAAAADDDRGNHVQLEPDRDRRIADREARELQDAGDAGERRGGRVDRDLRPFDGHAAEPRRPLVRAD